MEISLDNGQAQFQIKQYHPSSIMVNETCYQEPLVIMPNQLIIPWGPGEVNQLECKDFEKLLPLKPHLVLIGTGNQVQYIQPIILAPLIEHQIGFELMTTAAACRTYTVLMAEGRHVAACLFP